MKELTDKQLVKTALRVYARHLGLMEQTEFVKKNREKVLNLLGNENVNVPVFDDVMLTLKYWVTKNKHRVHHTAIRQVLESCGEDFRLDNLQRIDILKLRNFGEKKLIILEELLKQDGYQIK